MENDHDSGNEEFTCANCGVTKDQEFVVCPDCNSSFTQTGVSGVDAERVAKEEAETRGQE